MPEKKKVEKEPKEKKVQKPESEHASTKGKPEPIPVFDEKKKKEYENDKQALIDLCQGIGKNYFEIAKRAYHMEESKLWAVEFKNFVEFGQVVLEFEKSKLYQLTEIYKVFGVEFGYTADTIEVRNWTKLRGLVRLYRDGKLNKKNVDFWLKRVAPLRGDQLQDLLAEGLGKADRKEIQGVRLTFVVEADQAKVIERALTLVMNSTGSESRGKALELLCADYLAGAEETVTNINPKTGEKVSTNVEKTEGKKEVGDDTPY